MKRRRALLASAAASLVVAVALSAVLVSPAAANHTQEEDELWVTVAINAAGGDRLSVTDDTYVDGRQWKGLASDVALALGHHAGSFRAYEDHDAAYVELDDKLVQPNDHGRLSWAVDSGELQLLAQDEGYEVLILEVCTPRVRQVVDALVTPESLEITSPGSRCRGWYQFVDDPPIRAVVELSPDRDRYPLAVARAAGVAAIAFGMLGIGATVLRRGRLRRRSAASWVLGVGSALLVAPVGWGIVTMLIWWNGSAADPVLLSGGPIGEQVARTVLPGLGFVLPALLPAALLLTVPRKEKVPEAPPPWWPGPAPQPTLWWPQEWWSQWAAQGPNGQPPPTGWAAGPEPARAGAPAPPYPPPPQGAPPPPQGETSRWAPPGSTVG